MKNKFLSRFLTTLPDEDVARGVFVFPTHRAGVYAKEIMAKRKEVLLCPPIYSMQEFVFSLHERQPIERIPLLELLHQLYVKKIQTAEPWEDFLFWGDMLLSDFDEVDRHLINPTWGFKNLSEYRKWDNELDFLSEEQKEFIQKFWDLSASKKGKYRTGFIAWWENLLPLYNELQDALTLRNAAYTGLAFRLAAEEIESRAARYQENKLYFVGFNFLSPAEKKIMQHFCLHHHAEVHWDVDEYYLKNENQEAGLFLRQYQQDSVLAKTFSSPLPQQLSQAKTIQPMACTTHITQAQAVATRVQQLLAQGVTEESIALVLPDEHVLRPVLTYLSGVVKNINVTMGLPLSRSPLPSWFFALIQFQQTHQGDTVQYTAARRLMQHAYWNESLPKDILHQIEQLHQPRVALQNLSIDESLRSVFSIAQVTHLSDCLDYLITASSLVLPSLSAWDKEFALWGIRLVAQVKKLATTSGDEPVALWRTCQRMVTSLLYSVRVPFEGTPIKGIQVMGLLETACLDFDYVFILSVNEGKLPPSSSPHSYIPYHLRKGFKLPTPEMYEANYAYLFYRLLAGASYVDLFYVTQATEFGQTEKSRYLLQAEIETNWLKPTLSPEEKVPTLLSPSFSIEKNEAILRHLSERFEQGISPTALNTYLDCTMRFYFQFVLGLKQPYVPGEDDAVRLGTYFHRVIEKLYKPMEGKEITHEFIQRATQNIPRVLQETMKENKIKAENITGDESMLWHVTERLVNYVLQKDKGFAPFTIESVEFDFRNLTQSFHFSNQKFSLRLNGIADRIDRKDNVLRMVDYKTGKDVAEFSSVASLFDMEEEKRNKAAFQLMLYALLWHQNYPNDSIQPALYSRVFLSDAAATQPTFKVNKETLYTCNELLPEFSERLQALIHQIMDKQNSFEQTKQEKKCVYCAYRKICAR